jgi:hypothetical protein
MDVVNVSNDMPRVCQSWQASMDIISLTGHGKIIPGHCHPHTVTMDMTQVYLGMLKVSLDMETLFLDMVVLIF